MALRPENTKLLEHKRRVDEARRQAALDRKAQQVLRNRHAIARVASAGRAS